MGLPQEVVERIVAMLQDDRTALEACSLTCKAMFASTRHLIYQTIHVTKETSEMIIFFPAEKKQSPHWVQHPRSLSSFGERDLLKYARCLNIRMGKGFSPRDLEPHLQHFQSLDRIHTLTIHSYNTIQWHDVYNTYFTQFHPTLTTLALHSPIYHFRFVLQFALQFPNLENLTLQSLQYGTELVSGISVPPTVSRSPPLRGHFRCVGLSPWDFAWPIEFAFDLPSGINFRSIEFQDVHWKHGQHILDGCASALEEFTIRILCNGENEPLSRFSRVTTTESTYLHL